MRVSKTWMLAGLMLVGCQGGLIGDDTTSSAEDAIVGGVNDNSDPAVVKLLKNGGGFCTGTLVTPRHVLTAAHCAAVGPTQVGFGLNGNANRVNVAKVVADSRFNTNRLGDGFDTAVLTLATPVAASVAKPIPFNHDAAALKNGAQVRIVGFGRNVQAPSDDNSSNFGFGTKRELSVKLNQVQQRLLSIGATGGQKCFGDSGGPTFLNLAGKGDVVIGVTSFGNGDCSNGGFDSRVDAYLDFLDKEIPVNEQQPAPTPPGNGADVTPPQVRIVSPADGSTLKSGTVQLVAEASDEVALKDVVLTWAIPNQGRAFKVSCANPIAGITCSKNGATHTFSFAVGTGLRAFNFAAEDTAGNRTVTDESDLFFVR